MLFAKLLKGFNHISQFLPLFSEVVLDTRRDLQKRLSPYKPQIFQHLEPLGERLRADMSQRCPQSVKKTSP